MVSQCTECGKTKISKIEIDYSPSIQLFEQPIIWCKEPKIKYKTYCFNGFWNEDTFFNLLEFLYSKKLFLYCWYWDELHNKRCFRQFDFDELKKSLLMDDFKYLAVYFSSELIDETVLDVGLDNKGVYIDKNIWRKKEIIKIDAPIIVVTDIERKLYYMEFCSEYINSSGNVISKNKVFDDLAKEVVSYGKKHLK